MAKMTTRIRPKDLVSREHLRKARKWLGLARPSLLRQSSHAHMSVSLMNSASVGSDLEGITPMAAQSQHDLALDQLRSREAERRKSAASLLPRRGVSLRTIREAHALAAMDQRAEMEAMIHGAAGSHSDTKRSAWSMSLSALPLPIHSRDELSLRLRPEASAQLTWTLLCRRCLYGKARSRKGWYARLVKWKDQSRTRSLAPSSQQAAPESMTLPHYPLQIAFTRTLPDLGTQPSVHLICILGRLQDPEDLESRACRRALFVAAKRSLVHYPPES
eukprot:scaffold582_cov385-Prasinococcus_capsulatus_cf.AAC.43